MKDFWPYFLCALLPPAFYFLHWQEMLARIEKEQKNVVVSRERLAEVRQDLVTRLPELRVRARAEAAKVKGETRLDPELAAGLMGQELQQLAAGFPGVELGDSEKLSIPLAGPPLAEPPAYLDGPKALPGWPPAVGLRYEVSGPRPQVLGFLDKALATRHYLLDGVHLRPAGASLHGTIIVARLPGAPKL